MTTTARIATLLAAIGFPFWVTAQNFEASSGPPFTPENLINNVFLGEGVEVLDLEYEGSDGSVGFFNNAADEIGIQRGIVLSTGLITTAGLNNGVEETGSAQASTGVAGSAPDDPDLSVIANGVQLNDIVRYTITFIPTSDTLTFNYVFASEEYPEFTCSNFNDVFGFFISGPGINGPYANGAENIALIPGTDLPVAINNVNNGTVGSSGSSEIENCLPPVGSLEYDQFYNDNNGSNTPPVYDGYLDVFTAQAIVQPCSTYTIKIALADVGDEAYDSGVFLQAKSFGTGSIQADALTVSLDGSIAEGCAEATINFKLPTPAESDVTIDYTTFGEAIEGVDYNELPDPLVIPAGDTLISIPLTAFPDDLVEGTESLFLDIQIDPCNRDTIPLLVQDNPLVPIELGPDTTLCAGDSLVLNGEVPIPVPEPPSFSSTSPVTIPDIGDFRDIIFSSDIQVSGVQPPTLQPGVIQSVCIDSLEHRWIDDLDIFLISPSGQFMELTTDNGGNGGNGLGMDQFINTCFTPEATVPITSVQPTDVPFTGNWQPEGLWSDLYGPENLTNGTWTLQMVDDQVNIGGTLFQWTITFNPIYEINYSWSPTDGLSCSDCPNPVVTIDSTTTYSVTATDAYGCTVSDTITITVFETPPAPELSCELVTGNSITISWPDVPEASGYEVNVDSAGWTATSAPNSHTVSGLPNLTEVHFQVRALGECDGSIDTISCITLNDCEDPVLTLDNAMDPSCFGGNDGSLSVTASGEDGPFEYRLQGTTNTTGQFDNLPAGVYNVLATDTVGCVGQIAVTIAQPDSVDVMLVETPASCAGEASGQAALNINSGLPPYSFNWSNASTDPVQTNLSAGAYQLTLVDGNGCDFVYDVEITEPDSLQTEVTTDSVRCNGSNDGLAAVMASGGVAPYTYDFSGGSVMGPMADDLTAGNYTVSVTDANGCLLETGFTVPEPPALSLVTDTRPASCANGEDGGLSVQASGGSAPYAYQWFSAFGEQVGSTDTLSGLEAGEYVISLTDANGCLATGNATVDEPAALQIDFTTNEASCNGVADGQAELTVNGGTPPYTYAWSDNGNASDSRADLAAGDYTVSVTDVNGCTREATLSITAPTALQLDITAEATRCFDSTDGQATVAVSGGSGPYTYAWSNGQTGATATSLPPGSISVTASDANGCTAADSIEIPQAAAINLNLTGDSPSCFDGADGSLQASATGGAGNFDFNWSDGDDTANPQDLTAGTYSLTVTDGNNCSLVDSITLDQPTALSSDISTAAASCLPEPDGSATVAVEGGTPPYNYNWSDGQAAANATGLTAGTYRVTINDDNGCTIVDTAVVDAIAAIELTTASSSVSCNGGDDGQIEVSASGGEGNYNYNWSGGLPDQASQSALSSGTYTVTVADSLGCEAVTTVTLTQPAALQINLQVEQVGCAGGSDGQASAGVSGGTPPYSYSWSNSASGDAVSDLPIGSYSLDVTDANGCTASASFEVEEAAPIFVSADVEAAACFGDRNGSISLSVSGGLPPYDYTWSTGGSSSAINGLAAGEYMVTITDAAGCEVVEELFVPQPDSALNADLRAQDVSCFGRQDGQVTVDAGGGTLPYRYSIDGDFFSGSSTFLGLSAGDYQVTVRDANGCSFTTLPVTVGEPAPIRVDLGDNRSVPFGDTLQLTPAVTGGIAPLSYAWAPQDSSKLSCFDCPTPVVRIPFQTTVYLTVTDANGCMGEGLVTLFADKDRPVFVATGFTPNGDNHNDRLFVQAREGVELRVLYFRIFDRWGELLFENTDFPPNQAAEGWEGIYRGKPVQPGTYIWHIGVEYPDGLQDSFSGQTTIIR